MNTYSGFTARSRSTARLIGALSGAALALSVSSAALSADAAPQVKTAAVHAGFASRAGDVAGVHSHLHHTLNCLVGPDGEGFDSDEMNPCANLGNGAIPDADDDSAKAKLEEAAEKAREGIASDDHAAAQAAAASSRDILEAQ